MEEYIFHYTSIETLALILNSKSIRFNNLQNVDDINETQFSDDDNLNLSSHILISCWTNNEEENLAFWNMYTPNMKGVRIKLPKNMFQKYNFTTDNVVDIKEDELIKNSIVDKSECFNKDYWIVPFKDNFFEIIYTDDENLLRPKIRLQSESNYMINISEIGRYKSNIWRFQNEVRFKLFVLPTTDSNGNNIHPLNNFQKIMDEKIAGPIDNYFIKILDQAFEKMEITLGPKCSLSEEIIVKALLEKFNPTAKLIKNQFQGFIR